MTNSAQAVATLASLEEEGILTIGTNVGLDMAAEGIERRPELERLKRLGGVAGQGYFIARPMPAEQARTRAMPDLEATMGDWDDAVRTGVSCRPG